MRYVPLMAAVLAVAAPASAQLLAGEEPAPIGAIPGVVAGDAQWELFYADYQVVDGLAALPDGGVLFAQEQTNGVRKLMPDGKMYVWQANVAGAGAVSVDGKSRVFAVERTCTDPGLHMPSCPELTRVVQLSPERRVLANAFGDGRPLGRLNDLAADGQGGAYFTQGGLYHVTADGVVSVVAEGQGAFERFSNGVAISPDGKVVYVTDGGRLLAFDIGRNGATSNMRVFATLSSETKGFGGDGLEVDSDGRLYVTADAGVYVFDKAGNELGIIPTPRRSITVAIGGPGKRMLYIGTLGVVGPDGKSYTTPEGVRNVASTVYRVPLIATGL